MPAAGPPPSLADFLKGYAQGVQGEGAGDAREDIRRGSGYDVPGGVSAICWARQGVRDQALFRNDYTDTADGADLDRHVTLKYSGIPRIVDTFGVGALDIRRPAAGDPGTFYEGTRVELIGGSGSAPTVYAVGADTDVRAADVAVTLPIRATVPGPSSATTAPGGLLRFADSIFDPTFRPAGLRCGPGTLLESPNNYRARARQAKKDARVGYEPSIETALRAAGASNVVLLDASSLGPAFDSGLSHAYVGDPSFTTTPALLKAALFTLDDWTIAGCDVQPHGMQQVAVTLSVAVTLWQSLQHFDLAVLGAAIAAALVDAFVGRQQWWSYRLDTLQGVVLQVHSAIQTATVVADPPPPPVGFPAVLSRYVLAPTALTVTFSGPT